MYIIALRIIIVNSVIYFKLYKHKKSSPSLAGKAAFIHGNVNARDQKCFEVSYTYADCPECGTRSMMNRNQLSIVLFTLSSINTKKAAPPLRERLLFRTNQLQSVLLHLSEALAAVDRTVFARLEGHLAGLAAACANGVEHLALTTGSVLAGIAACLAALGLVLETTACVELLLTGGPNELFAAIFAYQSLVFVHGGYLLFVYLPAEEFQPTLGVTNELIAKLLGALFICPGQNA